MSSKYEKSIEKSIERNKLIKGAKESIERGRKRSALERKGIDTRGMRKSQIDIAYVSKMKTGGLKGNQKKLDKNNNGRIDAEDFKLLQGSKKGMRMGGVAGYGAARKSGMGLQDESMKPGKIIKAKSGYGMSSNKKRAMAEARARREQER